MVKIVFFDVDGTLLKLGCKELSKKTIFALNKLKENGIKIFMATGRPASIAPHFDEVEFDGMLSFSGQLCTDENGVIYSNQMDPKDVLTFYENTKKMQIPMMAADHSICGMNYPKEPLNKYFDMVNVDICVVDDFDSFITHPIYQMVVAIPLDQEEKVLESTTNLQTARWCDMACDIIPKNGGKEIGIQKILEHYGYTREESMSFGDGGNDKTMLEYTGIGVAMGNAKQEIKDIADYITKSVEDDGIYHALKYFDLI